MSETDPQRFDRLPSSHTDRSDPDRPTRDGILAWWHERFGVPSRVFDAHTFWERGAGKIWAFHDAFDQRSPTATEGLGMTVLRTRGEHWKPTLEAAQRFGRHASRNVIQLPEPDARTFFAGGDQRIPWDGDWGYLIVSHEVAGEPEPLGVGLYVHGELRSQVPKGRRREL